MRATKANASLHGPLRVKSHAPPDRRDVVNISDEQQTTRFSANQKVYLGGLLKDTPKCSAAKHIKVSTRMGIFLICILQRGYSCRKQMYYLGQQIRVLHAARLPAVSLGRLSSPPWDHVYTNRQGPLLPKCVFPSRAHA